MWICPCPDDAVAEVLSAALSQDPQALRAANDRLQNLALSLPEFGLLLCKRVAMTTIPLHERQIAAITLRQFISEHWCPADGSPCTLISPASRLQIRNMLLNECIEDESQNIRSLVAAIVAKIASFDFPDEWPDFLQNMAMSLSTKGGFATDAALLILDEFLPDSLGSDDYCIVFKPISDMLLGIFREFAASRNSDIARRALQVFTKVVDQSSVFSSYISMQFSNSVILPVLGEFWSAVVQVLQAPCTGFDSTLIQSKVAILAYASSVLNYLEDEKFNQVLEITFSAIQADLECLAAGFTTYQDETDAEPGSPLSYCLALLNFLITFGSKIFKNPRLAPMPDILNRIFPALLTICQISESMLEEWNEDINSYIRDEIDSAPINWTRRGLGLELIAKIHSCAVNSGFSKAELCMVSLFQRALESGNASLIEACLSAMTPLASRLESNCEIYEAAKNQMHFMQNSSSYLARVLLFSGAMASSISSTGDGTMARSQVSIQNVNFILSVLTSVKHPVVRIAAMKAAQDYAAEFSGLTELFEYNFQECLISDAMGVLTNLKGRETIEFALSTFSRAVELNYTAVGSQFGNILPILLNVWENNVSDAMISGAMISTISGFVHDKSQFEILAAGVFPHLTKFIASPQTPVEAVIECFYFLERLIRRGKAIQACMDEFARNAYPVIIARLSNTNTSTVLRSGHNCLAALIPLAVEQNRGGVLNQMITEYISSKISAAHQNTSDNDAGDSEIGLVLRKFYTQCGVIDVEGVLHRVNELFGALRTVSNPAIIQEIIVTILCLMALDDTGFNLVKCKLAETPVGGSFTSALDYFAKAWLENYESISSAHSAKISLYVLSKIIIETDSYFEQISVAVSATQQSNQRVTRSKSGAKTLSPFFARAIQILINEYATYISENCYEDGESSADDSSSSDDDNHMSTNGLVENDNENNELEKNDFDFEFLKVDMKARIKETLCHAARKNILGLSNLDNSLLSPEQQKIFFICTQQVFAS